MSLAHLATKRPVTIAMATLTIVLFGFISLSDLPINLLPDLSYPTLTIRTEYTGAAPAEVETLITEPIEETVGVVKNMRKLHSVSRTGQSDVTLTFSWGTDMDMAGIEVRDKLETLTLPLESKKPILLRFDPSNDPILRIGLIKKSTQETLSEAPLKQLRRFADEELKKHLEPIEGVAAVKIAGGLEDEIQVEIDQQVLAQLQIDINQVIARLAAENINISAGNIDQGNQRYLVRTVNQAASIDELRTIPIQVNAQVNDSSNIPTTILLQDIATITPAYKEREAIIRIAGDEAVELAIYKEGDANTVAVADSVKKAFDKLEKILPPDTKLEPIVDQSQFIRQALKEVKVAAFEGGLLAILIIFFFLRDAWATFIISLSLPVSIIATFFFMGQANLSLNVMSLGGLALATGMVVDDSIVVLENIARMRERGLSFLQAAIQGTSEVGMAVTASTLTTVAVFFPLVFVEGVAGQLFRDQALTITIAMLISLIVAMTLIPMLASLRPQQKTLPDQNTTPIITETAPKGFIKRFFHSIGHFIYWCIEWLLRIFIYVMRKLGQAIGYILGLLSHIVIAPYQFLEKVYKTILPRALNYPFFILIAGTTAFAGSLLVIPTLGMDLIPQLQQGQFELTVKLPPGTPLVETDKIIRTLQKETASSAIQSMYGVSGTGTRLDATPTEAGENIGRMLITLTSPAGSEEEQQAQSALRTTLSTSPGLETKFSRPQLLSFATPLEIEIAGYDLDALKKAGQPLSTKMLESDRFTDIQSTVASGYPELQIHFDPDRAAALGLTTRQIADQVVRHVRGEVATRYSFRDRKIDVLVRAQEDDRASLEDIQNIIINPESDHPTNLNAVAQITRNESASEIHRIDQERVAIISANLHYGDLAAAVQEVNQIMKSIPLTPGVTTRIGGQGEELDASVQSLIFALSLAVFLVYLVMASQFESLLHPFVIMFSIPLALVGAVLALKLTNNSLSVVVFIGLILLVGIVVKNAIVLIDRINQLRREGVEKRQAIIQAAKSRLRPIIMTTLTTLLGFLPLAMGTGDGAEVRAPMAITVIGGLAVSTLLTLIIIPVVYDLLDRRTKI